jgi:hypothetical protein
LDGLVPWVGYENAGPAVLRAAVLEPRESTWAVKSGWPLWARRIPLRVVHLEYTLVCGGGNGVGRVGRLSGKSVPLAVARFHSHSENVTASPAAGAPQLARAHARTAVPASLTVT